jgi:uncharacterized protein
MKKTFLAFTLLFCISIYAHAQTETKKEKIKTLFALMHQDSLINKTFDAMASSMAIQMASIFKDTIYKKAGINYSDKYAQIMKKTMEASKENAKKLINEDMVDIYDRYFAIEDIESFIAFYRSASGQKMLDKLPEITKDIMTAMTVKYQPGIQQSMMKEIEEMTKGISDQ